MNDIIIGIDLGTTNSEVAVVEGGRATIIAEAGSKILPSFVGIGEDGNLLVGEPAKNQYALYPERTVKSIKRKMGSDETVEMAGTFYRPQEISAMLLKRLKSIAEGHIGQPLSKAVITVPAYFSDAQRQATREAGEIAGLEVVRMINEPTAAALAYEAAHEGRRRILVYDLGGGTFDVSVVSIEDNVVEVLASHGNNHLGGDDFDQKIVEHILTHLRQTQDVDVSASLQAAARVQRAAEVAKRTLSDQPFALIEEEYLLEHKGAPVHLSLEIDRHDYEAMITPYIDETLQAAHIALDGAGLTVSDLDEVLLVGGSTRTPLVARRLEQELGLQPRSEVDPDLCVASGAAIQAAMIAGAEVSAVLVDVTPYTFGTSAFGELDGVPYPYVFVPIIPKNTPLPVSRSEVFYTMVDEQEQVEVLVFQGEERDALANIKIGEFKIEGLDKVPAGNPIVTNFSLDLDGILHVTTREKKTGLETSITIQHAIEQFEQSELAAAKERIQTLFAEEENEAPAQPSAGSAAGHHAEIQARALVEKAERMLEQASAEDHEELINLIEVIKDTLAAKDFTALNEPVDELSDILYYLES